VLSGRRWHYDRAGRPAAIEDQRWGTTHYRYDALGQLLEAKRGAQHEVFDYDVTGSLRNILTEAGASPSGWRLEPGNVLVEKNGTRYENDLCKRRTRKVEPGKGSAQEVTAYRWDVRDRLRDVRLPDGRRAAYRYDAFARRVSKELHAAASLKEELARALAGHGGPVAPERTRFLYDGDVLCAELRPEAEGGVRVHVHEARSFAPLLQVERGEVFTVVNDHLGMPKELVDRKGRVAWAAAHSAWGRVVEVQRDAGAAEVGSPFRLLGQYADEETGLCYVRFRYFDAEAGRWCSPDPLGMQGGRNVGALNGSPSSAIDPVGLACPKYETTGMDPVFKDWDEGRVTYLDENQRLAYLVTSKDGLLYDAQGNLLDTGSLSSLHSRGGAGVGIFVMDEYGNIYVGSHEYGEFHHSSFLAGGDVAAAGEIVADNGHVIGITDKSGHYKPDPEYSNQMLKELQDRGVDVPSGGVRFGGW
jgi:RHS repeat-associated protein